MAAIIRKLFQRKKSPPLVCSLALDANGDPIAEDPNHKHTAACFVDFEPLAVVELFQSQSCAACAPAIPDIHKDIASEANLVLLTFPVTLFDHLGWKDTLATSASDSRQRAYLRKWQRTSIFTPQLVVNGIADGSGAKGVSEIANIVQRARGTQRDMDWHIYVDANDTHVRIDSNKPVGNPEAQELPYDVSVVVYKKGDEVVKVGKGPNKGKKLNHRNIVTNVIKIGEWRGGDIEVQLPTARSAMRQDVEAVVIVQQGGAGGPIVAANKI